jgi:hypothetical protein
VFLLTAVDAAEGENHYGDCEDAEDDTKGDA